MLHRSSPRTSPRGNMTAAMSLGDGSLPGQSRLFFRQGCNGGAISATNREWTIGPRLEGVVSLHPGMEFARDAQGFSTGLAPNRCGAGRHLDRGRGAGCRDSGHGDQRSAGRRFRASSRVVRHPKWYFQHVYTWQFRQLSDHDAGPVRQYGPTFESVRRPGCPNDPHFRGDLAAIPAGTIRPRRPSTSTIRPSTST